MWVQLRVPASLVLSISTPNCARGGGKASRGCKEHPLLPLFRAVNIHKLCLTASSSDRGRERVRVAEWTIWEGLLTGCLFGVPGAKTVYRSPLFPFLIKFGVLRYRSVPCCRRCTEANRTEVWLLESTTNKLSWRGVA